jgi:hypothetical protein
MLFSSLITILIPLALALALPTTKVTEQWLIPRLELHMMSQHTGLPGDPPWPQESQFNTIIDFDVRSHLQSSHHFSCGYIGHTSPPHLTFL